MKRPGILRYKLVVLYLLLLGFVLSFPVISHAQTQDEAKRVEVSSFDEFSASLAEIQSTGGTVVLTQDISVPAGESYVYNNARYRKEVVIETCGHTIYVQGYLELWPFLTICGDGRDKELLHVESGGELCLVSISIDAGEEGVAMIQEEGSFLTYASEEDMGLPTFSCTGQILSAQTITAAAYWRYNCEKLPIVRLPDGEDFTADMLPDRVLSLVNRDHQELEEEVRVIWDDTTFPASHERTIVQGNFTDEYAQYQDYMPQCLVVWESDIDPFFLNVYLKSATQWYDMVYMYGESPQAGTVYIEGSDDGETWMDITGTEGYAPVEAEENSDFLWILSYDLSDPTKHRPQYYRLLQVLDDGTQICSDALELSDSLIFTAADTEGGRGGETSPGEGENQLPNEEAETEEVPSTGSSDTSTEQQPDTGPQQSEMPGNTTETADNNTCENTQEDFNHIPATENGSLPEEIPQNQDQTPQEADAAEKSPSVQSGSQQVNGRANTQKIVGMIIVVCILASSVTVSVMRRKK